MNHQWHSLIVVVFRDILQGVPLVKCTENHRKIGSFMEIHMGNHWISSMFIEFHGILQGIPLEKRAGNRRNLMQFLRCSLKLQWKIIEIQRFSLHSMTCCKAYPLHNLPKIIDILRNSTNFIEASMGNHWNSQFLSALYDILQGVPLVPCTANHRKTWSWFCI